MFNRQLFFRLLTISVPVAAIVLSACIGHQPAADREHLMKATADGDYILMNLSEKCGGGPGRADANCFLFNKSEARKVVAHLGKLKIKHYLLPDSAVVASGIENPFDLVLKEIVQAKGDFFLQEFVNFRSVNGNCEIYLRKRAATLAALDRAYGAAFVGFADDEPNFTDLNAHIALKACLQKNFGHKLFFTNLLPIYASERQIKESIPDFPMYRLAELGGCEGPLPNGVTDLYTDYTRRSLQGIRPDIATFDLYPFSNEYGRCPAKTWELLTTNIKIFQSSLTTERAVAYVPAFYMNFKSGLTWPREPSRSDITQLKDTYRAAGVNQFVYYLSFDAQDDNVKIKGLLDGNNDPTPLYELIDRLVNP